MRYALLDPRNGPMGPTPPEDTKIVKGLGEAKRHLQHLQRTDYDPPQWLEVFDADAWDGVSYGDLVGQLHLGPRNGATFEGA